MRSIIDIQQDRAPIIILGSCSTLPNVIESLNLMGRTIHGVMDRDHRGASHVHGLPLLPDHEYLRAGVREQYEFYVATTWQPGVSRANQRNNAKRAQYLDWMSRFNLVGATIVHPTAVISPGARIGRNVRIGALSMVNHGAEIHDHATVRDQAYVSHDTRVGEDSVVQIGARLTGAVSIGAHTYVGVSATIIAKNGLPMHIGDNVVIHPGVVVMSPMASGTVARMQRSTVS